MKSLFSEDKHESFTAEAMEIDRLASEALRPIVQMAKERGYSLRDVHYILNMSALDLCLSELIGWGEPEKPKEPKE